jgi:hypothetical protein
MHACTLYRNGFGGNNRRKGILRHSAAKKWAAKVTQQGV